MLSDIQTSEREGQGLDVDNQGKKALWMEEKPRDRNDMFSVAGNISNMSSRQGNMEVVEEGLCCKYSFDITN